MTTRKPERKWLWLPVILAAIGWAAPSNAANPADLEKLRTESTCERCDLQGADLRAIKRFDKGKLFMCQYCNLKGADLRGMNLSNAFLWHADLTGANLEGTILEGAILRGALLHNAKMRAANLDRANVFSASLNGADLSSASLRWAYMHGSGFRNATLVGAKMTDTDLTDADLSDAFVESADLRGAKLCGTKLSGQRVEYRDCPELEPAETGSDSQSSGGTRQQTATLAAGCEMRGQITSTSQNQLVTVSFENTGPSNIYVYWINYEGAEGDYESARQPLATIEAGASQNIDAFVGFAFSVFDESSNCKGVARIEAESSKFSFQ